LARYEARSSRAAAGFEAAVEVAVRAIATSPERWTKCDDQHRSYVLRRYPSSIIDRAEVDRVLVVAFAFQPVGSPSARPCLTQGHLIMIPRNI